MKASQIYSSMMWMLNEGFITELQFRGYFTTLKNRLINNGYSVSDLTDVDIINAYLASEI